MVVSEGLYGRLEKRARPREVCSEPDTVLVTGGRPGT